MPNHAQIIPATTPRLPTVSDGRGVFAEFVSSPCSALWGFHPHSLQSQLGGSQYQLKKLSFN